MPIYEYVCRQCGQEFEALVRNEEKPACPGCNSRRLEKKLSAPAVQTRSSGPACPAREMGACNMPSCGGGGCGLTGLG
jgi:putative FmdB family regulatory protein